MLKWFYLSLYECCFGMKPPKPPPDTRKIIKELQRLRKEKQLCCCT